MYTFLSPLASTMMAPALGDIAEEFRIRNSTVVALTLSIYLLAIAVGPLFIAPLSEIYGRKIALNIGIVLFVIFSVACALAPNTAALIIFRFLTGLAGSGPLAIGGGSISDVFDESERGAALGVFMMGPLLGPILGPVAGGFAADDLGQEWIFWILAILAGAVALVGVPLLQETYAPVIIAKKFSTTHHNVGVERSKNLWDILTVDMTRPIVLLTTNFICFILSLYTAA
ncbi:hypothetical protein FRC02_009391 [Tulasnella sp. 418]|nr:hypothetical protein FRC02_009391 [Tulasnella sp. 418]